MPRPTQNQDFSHIPEIQQEWDLEHLLGEIEKNQGKKLTPAQKRNLQAIVLGLSPKEAAAKVFVGENSLKPSFSQLYRIIEALTGAPEKTVTYKNAPLVLAAYRKGAISEQNQVRQFVGREEAIAPERRHYRGDLRNKSKQNLPPHENEFIGRQEELCKLMKSLSSDKSAAIITIDGIAGVGKTALILEAAWLCLEYREYGQQSPNYAKISSFECNIPLFDAIIFASAKEDYLSHDGMGIGYRLTGQRTLQDIYRTISETLDVPKILESNHQEQFNQVISSLKQQKTLLVIDNLETINKEEKERVMSFLYDLPAGVKTLITTREQLGYTPIRLSSLEERDAQALIKQQLEEKEIKLTGGEIYQLYKACDGIPLAIIYTIGRLARSCALKTILDDLSYENIENSDLATFCFSKSIKNLQQDNSLAYWLLLSIAIFQNPPMREAIIAVAGVSEKSELLISKSLETLQQISLVRYDHHRYRYKITALTREYALSELQKHQEFKKEAYQRLSAWYMEFARKNHNVPDRFITGYASIKEEWQNLLAVLRWYKDQDDYENVKKLWFYLNNCANLRGDWIDRLFWLGWIVREAERRGEKEIKTAIAAKIRRARINLLIGEYDHAETELLASWKIREHADFSDIDYVTNHLAGLYLRLEDYQEAHKWLDEEQRLLDQQNLPENERLCYQIYIDRERAELFLAEKKYQESKEMCNKVISQCLKIDNSRNQNYVKRLLAEIAINQEDLDTAEKLLDVGFSEVRHNHDKRRIACYQFSYAKLENAKGNIETNINQAQAYFKSAIESYANKAYGNFTNLGMKEDAKQVRFFIDSVRKNGLKSNL